MTFFAQWQGKAVTFLQRALYLWRWPQVTGAIAVFCALTAGVAAFWYTVVGWQNLSASDKAIFQLADFMSVLASYGTLFWMLNVGATLFYVLMLGTFVRVTGRAAMMPELPYAKALKLVLVTGMLPLALVQVFGQIMEVTFSFAMVLLMIHGLWLTTLDIPPPPAEKQVD